MLDIQFLAGSFIAIIYVSTGHRRKCMVHCPVNFTSHTNQNKNGKYLFIDYKIIQSVPAIICGFYN
jgi:hypothetical protein